MSSPLEFPMVPQEIDEVYRTAICLYSKQEVENAFDKLAINITERLAGSNPILLCVLVGGIVILGNLLPRLNFPLEVDYVHATRYQHLQLGSELLWKAKPTIALQNRNVLIVDDILDAGITLQGVIDLCQQHNARTISTAVLVDKTQARLPEGLQQADFTGLDVSNHFVFGYGLDYKGYLRNAPGIYKVASEYEE